MSYRRAANLDKNIIFQEYLNDEQSVRRNGGVFFGSDYILNQGSLIYDGTISNDLTYPDWRMNGGMTQFSIRTRVKRPISGKYAAISLHKSTTNRINLVWFDDDKIYFVMANGTLGSWISTVAYTNLDWVDIVGVYDNSVVGKGKIYINGAVATLTSSTMINTSTPNTGILRISNYENDSKWDTCERDLVEIYNKALTPEEVSNLYNDARYVLPSLNRSGLTKLLHVTAKNGVVQNILAGDTIEGNLVPELVLTDIEVVKDGEVLSPRFNGSTSIINCGDYNDLTGDITVMAWVKTVDALKSYAIFGNGKTYIRFGYSGGTLYIVTGSDGTTDEYVASIPHWKAGGYLFITWVRRANGNADGIYINGEAQYVEGTPSIPVIPSINIAIGDNVVTSGGSQMNGQIPETIVLSGLLTASEISAYYTSTKHKYEK